MVNVQGAIMPVVSMRRIYGLTERELDVRDQFIIVCSAKSRVALVVDEVSGTESCNEREIVAADTVIPGLDGMQIIIRSDGEIIILHNPDRLPDLEAVTRLETALRVVDVRKAE